MLSTSSRPNFNNWSQGTTFCFDVQSHRTLQLGFRYLHSSASSSYNPHTFEYLKIRLESLCKFKSPSLVTMSGYKESVPAASGCAHLPSPNSSDHTRRLLQSSPREPDAAKDSGGPWKQRQQMASAPIPSSVITVQGLEHTHGSHYHFCLVKQFKLYQKNSLFITLEKRPRHKPEPITPWLRKRKLADKIVKLQAVFQRKAIFFTLKRYWIQHRNSLCSFQLR